MKKKAFIMLPCIAAVAIATFVGKKTLAPNVLVRNNLLYENVEALAEPESGYSCSATAKCFSMGKEIGSVSCTGKTSCSMGFEWVKCDGKKTVC